jgi:hypothetical protein
MGMLGKINIIFKRKLYDLKKSKGKKKINKL